MGEAAVGAQATDEQIAMMAALAHQALDEGALGFTTSIGDAHNDATGKPVPSRHASRDEMVALASTVRDHPGTSIGITPPMGAFSGETMDLLTSMSVGGDRCVNWNVLVVDANDPGQLWGQLAGGDHAGGRGGSVVALTVPEVSRLRLSFANGMILNIIPGWGGPLSLPHEERKRALTRSGRSGIAAGRLRPMAAQPVEAPLRLAQGAHRQHLRSRRTPASPTGPSATSPPSWAPTS